MKEVRKRGVQLSKIIREAPGRVREGDSNSPFLSHELSFGVLGSSPKAGLVIRSLSIRGEENCKFCYFLSKLVKFWVLRERFLFKPFN